MHTELRGLCSPDVPEGLDAFSPEDAECFNLLVGAFIGPTDNGGEDLFYFSVCTATWLAEHPPGAMSRTTVEFVKELASW
jgi:immunity protein 8 of polymorphic toxin system